MTKDRMRKSRNSRFSYTIFFCSIFSHSSSTHSRFSHTPHKSIVHKSLSVCFFFAQIFEIIWMKVFGMRASAFSNMQLKGVVIQLIKVLATTPIDSGYCGIKQTISKDRNDVTQIYPLSLFSLCHTKIFFKYCHTSQILLLF